MAESDLPLTARVLFCEDDEMLRQMATVYLEQIGLDVIAAESAEVALARLEDALPTWTPDLVIADNRLPRMQGLQLAAAVEERVPGIAVLLMSGLVDDQAVAQRRGWSFIQKPFPVDEFETAIRDLLGT